MIELSVLELLYLVLAFFAAILGTLLSIVLIRVIKILGVIHDITSYYWKAKQYLNYYSQAVGLWLSSLKKSGDSNKK